MPREKGGCSFGKATPRPARLRLGCGADSLPRENDQAPLVWSRLKWKALRWAGRLPLLIGGQKGGHGRRKPLPAQQCKYLVKGAEDRPAVTKVGLGMGS